MALFEMKLIQKIALTDDVFELSYEIHDEKEMIPGQFITFILPGIGGRAYSIVQLHEKNIILIIKRWKKEDGGRGGSILLCDALVGDTFKAVWPAGHFTLKDTAESKMFLGTWTGLVPLWNMIQASLKKPDTQKIFLVFGVRFKKDFYYIEKFQALKNAYPQHFDYNLYVSREEWDGEIYAGYVTDALSENTIQTYKEFYICGAPGMIESCEEKLLQLGVKKEAIFFEKYS